MASVILGILLVYISYKYLTSDKSDSAVDDDDVHYLGQEITRLHYKLKKYDKSTKVRVPYHLKFKIGKDIPLEDIENVHEKNFPDFNYQPSDQSTVYELGKRQSN